MLPNFVDDIDDVSSEYKSHAAIFTGTLCPDTSGSGTAGDIPWFKVNVNDVDLDCDSNNNSQLSGRPPGAGEADEEDRLEYPSGVPGTDQNVGMKINRFEDFAQLRVQANAKGSCLLRVEASGDIAKFVLAHWNGGVWEPLTPEIIDGVHVYYQVQLSASPQCQVCVLGIKAADGVASDETAAIDVVAALYKDAQTPSYAKDPVRVSIVPDEVDTNRDELVDVGADISSFGPDTGEMAWQYDRAGCQLFIPLAVSQWDYLPVQAYLSQGAFSQQKNAYWHPAGIDSTWLAYSLHTRAKLIAYTPGVVKRVEVVRPRGNSVIFEFPVDGQTFKPYGLPVGVNNKRTYVLWDNTPSTGTDLDYSLDFDSGIIHHFNATSGLISEVLHIDGRSVSVSSLPAYPSGTVTSPRYDAVLTWDTVNKKLSKIVYTDRVSHKPIEVTPTYDTSLTDPRIIALEKQITNGSVPARPFELSVRLDSMNANSIQHGIVGGDGIWTQTRGGTFNPGAARTFTLATGFPGGKLISRTFQINANDLVTQLTVTAGGTSGTNQTSNEYNAGDVPPEQNDMMSYISAHRYSASQAPKWAKVTKTSNDLGYEETYTYHNEAGLDTGWVKTITSPFVATAKVEQLDYTAVGGGSAGDITRLVERPRTSTVSVNNTTISKTYYLYNGMATQIQRCATSGSVWNDSANLSTTVTATKMGLTSVIGPQGGVEYSVAPNDKTATVTATSKGPGGAFQATVDTINAFGYTNESTTTDTASNAPVRHFTTTTAHAFGFGRPGVVTNNLNQQTETITSYATWGPTQVSHSTGWSASTQYDDGTGLASQYTYWPGTAQGRKFISTYTRDSVGNVTATTVTGYNADSTSTAYNTSAGYDIHGRLRSATDREGKSTGIAYGAYDSLTKLTTVTTTLPIGQSVAAYYLDGRIQSESGSADLPVDYDYVVGATGKISASSHPHNHSSDVTTSLFNFLGQTESVTKTIPVGVGSGNAVTSFSYDGHGRVWKRDNPDGTTNVFKYDDVRNMLTKEILDVSPKILTSDGDAAGSDRVIEHNVAVSGSSIIIGTTAKCDEGDVQVTRNYNVSGLVSSVSANGRTTTVTTAFTGGGDSTVTTLHPDNTQSMVGFTGGDIHTAKDLTTTGADLVSQTLIANPLGFVKQQTGRIGAVNVGSNKYGQTSSVESPDYTGTRTTQISRNDMLQPATITRADTKATTINYNSRSEAVGANGAGTYNHTYGTDERGCFTQLTTNQDTYWKYYDQAALPKGKYYCDQVSQDEKYLAGQFTYNGLVQVSALSKPGVTFSPGYDVGTGEVTQLAISGENQLGYSYDKVGRVGSVSDTVDGQNLSWVLNYNVDSDLISETLPYIDATFLIEYNHDAPLRRFVGETLKKGQVPLLDRAIGYDAVTGRPSTVTSLGETYSLSYLTNSHLLQGTTSGTFQLQRSYESFADRVGSLTATSNSLTAYDATFHYNQIDQRLENNIIQHWTGNSGTFVNNWSYAYDSDSAIDTGPTLVPEPNSSNRPITSQSWTGNPGPWSADWSWEDSSAQTGPTRTATIDQDQGKVTLTTGSRNTESVAYLNGSAQAGQDMEITAKFKIVSSGDSFGIVVRGRFDGDAFGNGFDDTGLIVLMTAGSDQFKCRKDIRGLGKSEKSVTGVQINANTEYHLRAIISSNANGSTDIKVRVWSGATEPSTWIQTTDADLHGGRQLSAGRAGLFFASPSTATGNREFYVDNFTARSLIDGFWLQEEYSLAPGHTFTVAQGDTFATVTINSAYSAADIDAWSSTGAARFHDSNGSGTVTEDDFGYLITTLVGTLWGDANFDFAVNFSDYLIVEQNFNQQGGWAIGDFNHSGNVNFSDRMLLEQNYNTSTTNPHHGAIVDVVSSVGNSVAETVDRKATFQLTDLRDRFGMVARATLNGSTFGDGWDDSYVRADVGGSDSDPTLRICEENADGTMTVLGSVSLSTLGITMAVDTSYTIRISVSGTTVQAKVWAAGGTEPAWQLTQTTAKAGEGQFGVYYSCHRQSDVHTFKVDVSEIEGAIIPEPIDLTATAVGANRVDLYWGDTTSNERGFKIQRRLQGDPNWDDVADVDAGITAYSDTTVLANSTYEYQVKAILTSRLSGASNIATVNVWVPSSAGSYGKDHLAMAVCKDADGRVLPGKFFAYSYDTQTAVNGVGNRRKYIGGSGSVADFNSNEFNQDSAVINPGIVRVAGYAAEDDEVKVNGLPAQRRGKYYFREILVNNLAAPVGVQVTVEIISASTGQSTVKTYWQLVRKYEEKTQRTLPEVPELGYDLRGNKISDSLYSYSWDRRDRLTCVTPSAEILANGAIPNSIKNRLTFAYDSGGRRIGKKVEQYNGSGWTVVSHTKFAYSGWLLIAEMDALHLDVNEEHDYPLVRSYAWGMDMGGSLRGGGGGIGGLLAVTVWDVSHPNDPAHATTYKVVSDERGNVVQLLDTAQSSEEQLVASFEYGPFGEMIAADGPAIAVCPLLFSTKYLDQELAPSGGLYYYGYRYYDPTTGKWLNRDPLEEEGGFNLYALCGNDPVNRIDPKGTFDLYYHEQMMREAFKGTEVSDDVLLALIVYNFETDIMANYLEYTKAASNLGETLSKAQLGLEQVLGRDSFMPADGTERQMLTSYYKHSHMDDLQTKGAVMSYFSSTIDQIVNWAPEGGEFKIRLTKYDLQGNLFHKLQDGFSHSNWAELSSDNHSDADPRQAKSLYDIFGPKYSVQIERDKQGAESKRFVDEKWQSDKKWLSELYSGAYSHEAMKGKETHDKLNKDSEKREFFDIAYAAAAKTTKEVAADWLQRQKLTHPDLYKELTTPLSEEDRNTLKKKYQLYKTLSEKVGHWRNEKEKK